ncbi:MAG: citrate/2-methylcitrate synthase [Fuerstiella sp.]
MEQATPAPHLVNGLRHLVRNISSASDSVPAGLDGVVCGETDLIGFYEDRVEYFGVDVQELCDAGSFESVIWLLLNETLPTGEQLADCCSILNESAVVDQPLADTIGAVPLQTRPLDLFPLAISMLSCFDPTPCDRSLAASQSQFWRVIAQLPVLMHVAFGGRLQDGRALDNDETRSLSFAGRLLQILRNDNSLPSPIEEQAMNTVMICECLTEMRPACFLSRFFGSTVNDVVAGLKAAASMYVSQLRNDPFAWTTSRLKSFRSPEHAEEWWRSRKPRTMPFGFQLEPEDCRAAILRFECRELLGSVEHMVMESAATRLAALQAREGYHPTVDWLAARVLTMLEVPEDRISLAIGIARMAGWAAQTFEQHGSGIPLLPSLRYAGDQPPRA